MPNANLSHKVAWITGGSQEVRGAAQIESKRRRFRFVAGDARRNESLGGPVHDFPIAQVAATAEGDRAGPNAAQRQGDAFEMLLIVPVQDRPGIR